MRVLKGWFTAVALVCAELVCPSMARADPELLPPVFSAQGGAYLQPVQLSLDHPDPDVRIYYTLDGSSPGPELVAGATFKVRNQYEVTGKQKERGRQTFQLLAYRYREPLLLHPPEGPDRLARIATSLHQETPPYFPSVSTLEWHQVWRNRVYSATNAVIAVFNRGWRHVTDRVVPEIGLIEPEQAVKFPKGVVVRALAVKGKHRSSVVTNTYFVGQGAFTALPIVSLVGPADGFFGYKRGILVPGRTFDDWRQLNPGAVVEPATPANWNREHDDVQANVEYFAQGGASGLVPVQNQVAGVRVHGGLTRVTPNKSMRLYARKKYGAPHFQHDFFGDGMRHRRVVLRNSGSDSIATLFRDAVIHDISKELRFEKQRYIPLVVFLNGEYRGIYNLREFEDEHYLAEKYGIDPDDIDLMDGNKARHGDDKHWRELLTLLEGDIASPGVYAKALERMDVDSFIDYQIANIFFGNSDWPHNNIRHWRRRVAYTPGQPSGMDGRWRWMMFDVDFGMQTYRRNALQGAANEKGMRNWNDTEWSTVVFRRLLTNKVFRQRFESRFVELLEGSFSTARVIAHIDQARDRILSEVPRHVARWKTPVSVQAWDVQIEQLRRFARRRPAIQRAQLQEFLGSQP